MADYSRFDKIQDSDDEDEAAQRKAEEKERRLQDKADEERSLHADRRTEIERWLKPRITRLVREREETESGCPELDSLSALPARRVTDDERKTLSMFAAVTHCGRHDTNIERHHDIMNLARQNQWLEEDPGTLELLCQVHREALKAASEKGAMGDKDQEMCDFMVSAINTLAAPSRAGCKDGYGKIYALFAMICEPTSKHAWDVREKYTKKEYAAEALLDSLTPSFEDSSDESNSAIFWFLGLLAVVLLFAAAGLYLLYRRSAAAAAGAALVDVAQHAAASTTQLGPSAQPQQEL